MKRPMRFVVLIALTGACGGSGVTAPSVAPDEVVIQNFAFNPAPRSVAAGTTVTWINHDAAQHTATGGTGTETWDSGALARNRTFSHTFAAPGTYTYQCSIHPSMRGTIIVN